MNQSKISLRDVNRSYEAHNLLESSVVDTVRPWFADLDQPAIKQAITALADSRTREEAMKLLGLELLPAA
ncbi:hypothetical protein [Boudabousia marimammalium]|nr:hypothetical protein [Boudabousia marimammalium]